MNRLYNLEELEIYKNTGLIEIAKHNSQFHGYWEFSRLSFYRNFDNLLKHNIPIYIPDIGGKFIKKQYIMDIDYF